MYVGRLDDADFVANKDTPGGAVPRSHSHMFPNGRNAFYEVIRRIERRIWSGEATQHIAYVAPASKETIIEFFEEMYREDSFLKPGTGLPHLIERAEALRVWINDLVDDGNWCLVASE